MGKLIKNSSDIKALEAIKEDLVFLPSPNHRRAKSKFWSRYGDLEDGSQVTLAAALQLTKEPQLAKWWNLPGFKDWFLNKDEARERLEYLWYLGMDAMEQLFLDPEANHNAKVNAFKQIASLAGKEPNRNEKFADEDIQKMDKARLKAYILKHAPKQVGPSRGEDTEDGSDEGVNGEAGPQS